MCPASAEDKYYAIRLIKYSLKKRKKIKNTWGPYILLHKSMYIFTYDFVQYVHVKLYINFNNTLCIFLHPITYNIFM